MEGIEIPIGADVKGFQQGVNEVEGLLKGLASKSAQLESQFAKNTIEAVKLGNSIDALKSAFANGEISAEKFNAELGDLTSREKVLINENTELEKSLRKLNNQSTALGGGMQKAGKSTANATPALMEFSRVIQDAPYGIQGVGNNIQQLTANFGYLSKSAGGVIPALKLMASSLIGPAGILLAVSTVTSLLTVFGKELFGASEKQKDLAESTKDTNNELQNQKTILEDLTKDFSTFNKIKAKSTFNTIKEREELKSLSANVLDYTLSEKQRSRILKELQENYGKYYDGIKINDTNALIKAEEAVNQVLLRREKRLQTLNKLELTGQAIQNNLIELGQKRASVNKEDIDRVKFLDKEILKLQTLQTELRNALEGYSSFDLNLEGKGDVSKTVKDKLAKDKYVAEIPVDFKTPPIRELIETEVDLDAVEFETVDWEAYMNLKDFDLRREEFNTKLTEFTAQANKIVNGGLRDAFSGIGNVIGEAMVNGGNVIEGLGGVLLGAMGGVLQQLGVMAITTGTALEAIKKALLNPLIGGIGAIGAGLALIAVGSAFSAGARKIATGGGGGSSSSNAGTSTGSSGGGFTGGFSGSSGNQRVVFELAGRKLIGVIQNEIRAQGNSGVNFAF